MYLHIPVFPRYYSDFFSSHAASVCMTYLLFPEKLNFWNVPRNFCINVVQVGVAWFESSPAKRKAQKWCPVFYTNEGEKKTWLWAVREMSWGVLWELGLWLLQLEFFEPFFYSFAEVPVPFRMKKHLSVSTASVSIAMIYFMHYLWKIRSSNNFKSKSSLSISGCSQPWRKLKIIVYICAFCAITVHSNRTHTPMWH